MALKEIKKEEITDDLKGILLNLDNGDLISVDAIKTKWKFKSRQDVLRYALAVIAQSDNPIVFGKVYQAYLLDFRFSNTFFK